jgi:hypothetical protein
MRKTPYIENTYIGRHPHFFMPLPLHLSSRLTVRGWGWSQFCEGDWSVGFFYLIFVHGNTRSTRVTNDLANFLKHRSLFNLLLCGTIPATTLVLYVTLLSATTASQNRAYPEHCISKKMCYIMIMLVFC